jgi:hypothetical protein
LGILQIFAFLPASPNGIFMACCSIVLDIMKTTPFLARQMSLALLVIAVVDHGHLHADYSGAAPNSSGLLRLGRDLMRRAGAYGTTDAESASDRVYSRARYSRQ